jgi:Zinc knuckle
MTFLKGLDRKSYGKLLEDLSNTYISGKDNYPVTLEAALSLVSNYQHHQVGVPKAVDNDYTPMAASFAQTNQLSRVRCFSCGERGHISKNCPRKAKKAKKSHTNNQVDDDDSADNRSRSEREREVAGWFRG